MEQPVPSATSNQHTFSVGSGEPAAALHHQGTRTAALEHLALSWKAESLKSCAFPWLPSKGSSKDAQLPQSISKHYADYTSERLRTRRGTHTARVAAYNCSSRIYHIQSYDGISTNAHTELIIKGGVGGTAKNNKLEMKFNLGLRIQSWKPYRFSGKVRPHAGNQVHTTK